MASPCSYTYNGKKYSFSEFAELLHSGELKKLEDAKTIDLSGKKSIPPTPPKGTEGSEGGDGGDVISGLTKAEQSKYDAAKQLFDAQKSTTWNDIVSKAVEKLVKENPSISFEKAAENHVNRLAKLYDEGNPINPTAEDLAIISLHKLEVERQIADIKSDNTDPIAAIADLDPLYQKIKDIAKASNPREAGTAFGIRQMLVSMGQDGLKIMRMEMMKDKGGKPLTENEMKFTAEQFAKEKELIEKKAELEKQQLQDKFDAELKAQAEAYKKLQEAKVSVEGAAKKAKSRQERLKESGKDFADKLRSGKISGAMSDPFLVGKGLNLIIDKVADLVEGGATLAAAIDKYVSDNRLQSKRKVIEDAIFDHLDRAEKRQKANDKLDEIIGESQANTITKEMTDANVIKDFVDSYVNTVELDKVSDVAYKLLKEKLPNIDKEQFKRAYLKQGEFKPTTSKELRNEVAAQKRSYAKLTQLETRLGELKKTGDLLKNPKAQEANDEKIQRVKDEIDKELLRTGKKKNANSKLQREADKKISESHDRNIDNFVDHFNKVVGGEVTKEIKDAVKAVTDALGKHKIDYNENSSLSQSGKIKKAIEGLENVKEAMESVKKDIPKDLYYDMYMALQNIKDVHEKVSEDVTQTVMLAEAKQNALNQAKEFERKLINKEFDDTPPKKSLNKTDAELVKLNADLALVKSAFDKRKEEYRKANRNVLEVLLDTGKAIAVNTLIGLPKTFVKLAWASPAKIMTTYLSKATVGQLNSLVFDRGLRLAAKEGGESSSFQSINRGLDAVFKHSNEKDLEKQSELNANKYEQAVAEYEKDKTDANKRKMENALRKSVSDIMYHFIGGKTAGTFWEKLLHRNTQYEKSLGEFNSEELKGTGFLNGEWKKNWFKETNDWKDVADNIAHIFSFIGRSHGALKSISARFHYAASFMAKLEGAMERGEDIHDISTLQKISAESFADWEAGMYQQHNWVTETGNKVTNWLKDHDNKFAKAVGQGLSWDVAITKVPVNMINEAIMEMTFGLPRSFIMYAKERSKAKGIVKAAMPEIKTPEQKAEFKQRLSEELSKLDKDQAAQILRAFRHGGLGLGLMALSTTLLALQYGGWHHLGQKKDDEKKKEGEAKTGEIILGNTKLNDYLAASLEHTNAVYPTLMYENMLQNYNKNKSKNKKGAENLSSVMYKELEHVIETYPQAKIMNPLTMAKEIEAQYSNQAKKAITTYSLGAIQFDDGKQTIQFTPEQLKSKPVLKDVKIPQTKKVTYKTEKNPTGELTEEVQKEIIDSKNDKLQKLIDASLKIDRFKGWSAERINEEIKRLSNNALDYAKEKKFGKRYKTYNEAVEEEKKNAEQKIFDSQNQ